MKRISHLLRIPCLGILLAFASMSLLPAFTSMAQTPDANEVPEPFRTLVVEAPKRVSEFPEVSVGTKSGAHQAFTVRLDEKPLVIGGEHRFGCFRFKTPKEPSLDMVWIFTVPPEWSQWYILSAEGAMEGFRHWLAADRLYEGFPPPIKDQAYLQTLEAGSLKPDSTYIIWFYQKAPSKGPATLTAAINFLPGKKKDAEWDHEQIEKGLGLKSAPAARQVEQLGSRGGRILLDARFFRPKYAELRIDNLLTSLRHSRSFGGGMFIEMRMQVPPCGTDPLLADIIAAHGEADLVLSADERRLFSEEGEDVRSVCYYDRFGFVLGGDTKKQHIYGVLTQASDVSEVRPRRDGLTWGDVPLPEVNLRVFFRDKKEIARVAFWGNENARVISGELPAETYRRDFDNGTIAEELIHAGGGEWEYRAFTEEGQPVRTAKLVKHAFHGILRDTYPDGKPRAEAPYKNGKLDGVLKQWNRNGEMQERMFRDGKPVGEKAGGG
jgi:hypothetical protein